MGAAARSLPVTVEPATRDDLEPMRDLPGLGVSTRALLPANLAADDHRCLVARHDGEVVGMAVGLVGAGEAHLLDVAVAPHVRRRGVGRQLVDRLRTVLRDELGATAMTLEVRPSNTAARAMYRELGFQEAGERPNYYPDGGPGGGREAAVIMWDRDLNDR